MSFTWTQFVPSCHTKNLFFLDRSLCCKLQNVCVIRRKGTTFFTSFILSEDIAEINVTDPYIFISFVMSRKTSSKFNTYGLIGSASDVFAIKLFKIGRHYIKNVEKGMCERDF